MRARLVSAGISGWRMHAKEVAGKPDFAFSREKVAVFIDGCFWHGCRCKTIPESNREFWLTKIVNNRQRDKKVSRLLKKGGWTVLRFWEHEMKKDAGKCLDRVMKAVGNNPPSTCHKRS